MKVPFSEIARGGVELIVQDTGWSTGSGMIFSAKPSAELSLNLLNDITAAVEGRIMAAILSECSRCGVALEQEIDSDFTYICRLGPDNSAQEKEREVSDEDSYTVFVDEPIVDVSELLEEQLILLFPEKLLCSKDCKGLCFKCGASLNTEECQCSDDHSDSPFAVLKKLKK